MSITDEIIDCIHHLETDIVSIKQQIEELEDKVKSKKRSIETMRNDFGIYQKDFSEYAEAKIDSITLVVKNMTTNEIEHSTWNCDIKIDKINHIEVTDYEAFYHEGIYWNEEKSSYVEYNSVQGVTNETPVQILGFYDIFLKEEK